ncbi:M3 family metallopeptidase [Isoptericola chiayiensis]|uniref:M3 family metallopeptidase n=2 Tax=Isoptericola chiayiensis TaxID=579446 RepID=A0ABP8YE22_9MICO|nr:M3 family metallopeptidase [Isoptericola chiayiensis]NOV99811.1 peptidyl-dipeptidase Dcp [Isoptericola chiayiensis]
MTLAPDNPFARPSDLPYGLPDYDAVRVEHYEPALRAGLAEQRAELDAIAGETDPPTVANTLDALERSGRLLRRAALPFFNQLSADANDALEDLHERLAADLAAHRDAIYQDARLRARLVGLRDRAEAGEVTLEPDQAWLLRTWLKDFRRAGIDLSTSDQEALRDLNARLTELSAAFSRRLLAGEKASAVLATDPDELAGLTDDELAGAAQAATEAGHEGAWLVGLQLPTRQDVVGSLDHRATRRRVQQASETRGSHGDDHDTRGVLLEIARLRAERARLLGYPHHAAYVAEDATAGSAEAVAGMLGRLAPAAVANARTEGAALREVLHRTDPGAELCAADWAYLAGRVRGDEHAPDDAALRPYLELERVVQHGVLEAAHRLYGLSFVERHDLTGYHPDTRIFEVFDAPEPGRPDHGLGLFVADWYTRPVKRGGAWMNTLVDQNRLLGERPVVVNNLNIVKPAPGRPTLLGRDQVRTLFHEFGHALHGLLSDVRYPSQSGTSVPRDFVEFPSQVNEMWAWDPQILRSYAVHHVTGEPLPPEWIDHLTAERQDGEGFATTEYLGAALLDQAWHRLAPHEVPTDVEDVATFEAAALAAAGLDDVPVPPRYRSTYFNHVWGSGYAAAYYSYIWSEVLDADTVRWYRERGGLTRENGEEFRRRLLARGGSQDPLASFRDLRGRDAEIGPLLARRGLGTVSS